MNTLLEARLFEEAWISFTKLEIRNIGVQLLRLAQCEIGQAAIIAVGSELPACPQMWINTPR
jgi:hypothetical protein